MREANHNGVINLVNQNELSKDSDSLPQTSIVFRAFQKAPKTMLMVSAETGILRANICRYVANWCQENKIRVVKTGLCKISNRRANYLSTNPMNFN